MIRVFSASATGPTALAAFDRALQVGGVHDTNLIMLSSIVPSGADVKFEVPSSGEFTVGDRLYCVLAEQRAVERGSEAWAGLGWAVDQSGDGGIFVEAHGFSEHQVRYDLEQTLGALCDDRPYWELTDRHFEVVGIDCDDQPVCALVMAVFESAPWRS